MSAHVHFQRGPLASEQGAEDPELSCSSSGSDSEDDEADRTWDDWVSDSASNQPCRSLFDSEKSMPSLQEALEYDIKQHGFDLPKISQGLALDFQKRIRLVNYIRRAKPTPKDLGKLTGQEPFFISDEYLIPVFEDDPYLQLPSDEPWSDDEGPADATDPRKKVEVLEEQLQQLQRKLAQMDIFNERWDTKESESSSPQVQKRDDDSHYFQSYGEHDIHAVMIQDKVRTSTYASFILRNPTLFEDAIVLDVGCGTGILSLFAAKGGAKKVYAVDASDIAEKAEQIVKTNGLDHIITVIRGKVEDIVLPDGVKHVDVIISEWMGYALLYESMLDSVLHARDRFLRPDTGVMAPSQCQMMLALADASEILKDRVDFWNDVYGFDLSIMCAGHYEEAIIDVLPPSSLLSLPSSVKDLPLGTITTSQLDFATHFTLVSTASKRTKVSAFVLYFDTFFTLSGKSAPEATEVAVVGSEDMQVAEIWAVGGSAALKRRRSVSVGKAKSRERLVDDDGEHRGDGDKEVVSEAQDVAASFSTGPQSMATHWKQTVFLLREPIAVTEGNVIEGKFYCKKSPDNSRELDVEIHYSFKESTGAPRSDRVHVQMYKVR